MNETNIDNIIDLMNENTRLRAQLPDGMKDCTIVFKECERGHGTLTATNWVQHECQHCEIDRLREAVYQFQKFAIKRGEQLISANNELLRLRALLETANIYGAGENAARLAAEEERDDARREASGQAQCCVANELEVDRLRAEVSALKLERRIADVCDMPCKHCKESEAERDRLRADVAVLRDELGIARERIRYFGKSTEAIDFAMKEQKK